MYERRLTRDVLGAWSDAAAAMTHDAARAAKRALLAWRRRAAGRKLGVAMIRDFRRTLAWSTQMRVFNAWVSLRNRRVFTRDVVPDLLSEIDLRGALRRAADAARARSAAARLLSHSHHHVFYY